MERLPRVLGLQHLERDRAAQPLVDREVGARHTVAGHALAYVIAPVDERTEERIADLSVHGSAV
ncbi:hypothetical protein GCM10009679_52760 [Saccharothrix algeriensis]|uniref:Uncharacterized protein n=1 Tax=Catellatospora bangladeshensis TaxID=310355 RepID=A0A8J3J922_9ACTN|nr:hypothetical protein Cba03nite_18560 [Catellatospora bangladeshensis]